MKPAEHKDKISPHVLTVEDIPENLFLLFEESLVIRFIPEIDV